MASLKFLVVDDATFIRDLLKKNLRDNFPGCEVLDAPGVKKAQVILKSHNVDLVLCDWEMPEITGEEFLRWLRASEKYQSVPFIMVTSRGERDFIVKAVEAGVSDYLGKPFKPESLVGKVTKALKKAGKLVNARAVGADARVQAAGSLEVLTGGATQPAKSAPKSTPASTSVDVLTGGGKPASAGSASPSSSNKPTAKQKKKSVARGQAQLNFPEFKTQCIINDITLQMLRGAIKREEHLPAIFDSVVISIVQNNGEDVARLNGYVHSVEAAENHINSGVIKLGIRFVDDDAQKLEQLSRYIATL